MKFFYIFFDFFIIFWIFVQYFVSCLNQDLPKALRTLKVGVCKVFVETMKLKEVRKVSIKVA